MLAVFPDGWARFQRRRARHPCCAFMALLCLIPLALPISEQEESSSAFATFDWTIAETLLALGTSPVAMGNVEAFHRWTGQRYRDAEIINIGIQTLPNLELLSRLRPELVLLPPRHRHYVARIQGVSAGKILDVYPYQDKKRDTWEEMAAFTAAVGRHVRREVQAMQLIENTTSYLASQSGRIADDRPFMVIQLLDEQHVRIYGDNSLFQAVLRCSGATPGPSSSIVRR